VTGDPGQLRVLFFAGLREEVGTGELSLELTEACSLEDILRRLQRHLSAAAIATLTAENVRIALNHSLITPPVECHPGDELAFLPPVTGG
jgi:molybdopterin converting factor small subunit